MRERLRTWIVVAVVLTALTLAPAAWAGQECAGLANCTSVANTPWVAVDPAISTPSGPVDATAYRELFCTDQGQSAAGFDYNVKNPNRGLFVDVRVPPFNTGTADIDQAAFVGINPTQTPNAFQPLLGCIPRAQAATGGRKAAQLPGAVSHHIKAVEVEPSRKRRHGRRCPDGRRLLDAGHSVAFHEERPPTARELRHQRATLRERRRSASVRLRTGPTVGDDERVELQLHLFCR